jgi:hypothetical protein
VYHICIYVRLLTNIFFEEPKKFDVQIIRRLKLILKEERIAVDQMTNVFGDGKNISSSFNSLFITAMKPFEIQTVLELEPSNSLESIASDARERHPKPTTFWQL